MFARKPRLSIAKLMLIVSILAAEFGLLRAVWDTTIEMAIIFLPSLNFMLLGLPKLRRGQETRPFWIGFDLAAITLIGLVVLLVWRAPEFFLYPWGWLRNNKWITDDTPLILVAGLFAAVYSLPQLTTAWFVGWLSSRYRIVIERRPRASGAWEPAIEEDRMEIRQSLPTLGEQRRPAVD